MAIVVRVASVKRVGFGLALLLMGAVMLTSVLSMGRVQGPTSDDYGIAVGAMSQSCPNGTVYDAVSGQCVVLIMDDE